LYAFLISSQRFAGKEKLEPVGHRCSNLRTAMPHRSKSIHRIFLNVITR